MSHDCGYQYVATTELYLLVVRFPYILKYATDTKIPIILHLQVLRLCDDEIAIWHIISTHTVSQPHFIYVNFTYFAMCVPTTLWLRDIYTSMSTTHIMVGVN